MRPSQPPFTTRTCLYPGTAAWKVLETARGWWRQLPGSGLATQQYIWLCRVVSASAWVVCRSVFVWSTRRQVLLIAKLSPYRRAWPSDLRLTASHGRPLSYNATTNTTPNQSRFLSALPAWVVQPHLWETFLGTASHNEMPPERKPFAVSIHSQPLFVLTGLGWGYGYGWPFKGEKLTRPTRPMRYNGNIGLPYSRWRQMRTIYPIKAIKINLSKTTRTYVIILLIWLRFGLEFVLTRLRFLSFRVGRGSRLQCPRLRWRPAGLRSRDSRWISRADE